MDVIVELTYLISDWGIDIFKISLKLFRYLEFT